MTGCPSPFKVPRSNPTSFFALLIEMRFGSAFVACILVVAVAVGCATAQDKPDDLPCVIWEPLTYYQNTNPTDLFIAAYTWVLGDGQDSCTEKGDIFPCFSSDPGSNTWGHHDYQVNDIPNDYCRSYINGSVYMSYNMYVPRKGPKWQTWKWKLAQTGGVVPANAIRFGDKVMARSTTNPAGQCCGKGFTGWAEGLTNGKFGSVHFSINSQPVTTDSFEVAICEAYHPTTTTTQTETSTAPPPTTTTTPPPVTTTAKPTLPPNTRPYIRFGNTIPSANNVDAIITQGNMSYTWSNYAFGKFSHWVEVFVDGYGTIQVFENTNGQRGPLLVTKLIPLTPGPLVVVVKDYWPPHAGHNIETIAASYVPIAQSTGVRLFNLSPDTKLAGMTRNSHVIIDKIDYTLGSSWVVVPEDQATFSAFDDANKAILASDTTTPPSPPFVFTNFLIGLNNATGGSTFATRLVPLIDAPES